MRASLGLFVLTVIFPLHHQSQAQDTDKKTPAGIVVVNSDGKEYTLKNWKIVLGARTLVLSGDPVKVPAKGDKKEPAKQPSGPEYLEMREDNSTTFLEGILTLVPIASIRRIDYDDAKKSVSVTMVRADDKEVVLTGTTKYGGINKLTIEGEIDAPGLDSARIRVQGGLPKAKPAVKSFRFPQTPQSPPKATGPAVVITAVGKEKTEFKAHDIKALYSIAGQDRISANLLFKKQAKIELAKIVTMKHVQVDKKQISDFEVALNDGMQFIFTLIKDTFPDDNSPAQLRGLIGKVPEGYRLFPPHTIKELRKEE